ncbi:hypothetical protein ACJJTC_011503 [Scirpophaga incertulas]
MKRSTYIAQIWCNAYKQIPSTLLPIRYGWILNDGRYDFDWFHGEECPQKVCDITAPDEESGEENDDVIGKLINLNIFNLYKCAGTRRNSHGAGLGSTFARTLPPAYKISKSVMALLKAYGWNKFAIVVGEAVTAAAQQKKELAKANGMIVTAEHSFADYIPLHISDMERIVDQTYDKTRAQSKSGYMKYGEIVPDPLWIF